MIFYDKTHAVPKTYSSFTHENIEAKVLSARIAKICLEKAEFSGGGLSEKDGDASQSPSGKCNNEQTSDKNQFKTVFKYLRRRCRDETIFRIKCSPLMRCFKSMYMVLSNV